MRFPPPPPWPRTVGEARQLQAELCRRVQCGGGPKDLRYVAGADISCGKGEDIGYGAVVVLSFPEFAVIEQARSVAPITFPYVPGFLAFREGPLLLDAFARLENEPDLILFDGHGLAHPRRAGLATCLGVLLNRPSVGVAKTRLFGTHEEVSEEKGSRRPLLDPEGQQIGTVLRTRTAVSPIFVSVGHKVGLDLAVRHVLACCPRFRIPQPTREAHRIVTQMRAKALRL